MKIKYGNLSYNITSKYVEINKLGEIIIQLLLIILNYSFHF